MFPPTNFHVSAIYDIARNILICLPSAALRATNIAYNNYFCNILRNKFNRVSTFRNIEHHELYHLGSFCHIAQQIISGLPFATVASSLLAMIASSSLQCMFCIFARNKYYRLSSFGNVQPPAILISYQEPLKFKLDKQ